MPSVGSIAATLERIHHHEQLVKGLLATFPLIDPLDAFYLLNPSGDLSETQLLFEDWFRNQNLVVCLIWPFVRKSMIERPDLKITL